MMAYIRRYTVAITNFKHTAQKNLQGPNPSQWQKQLSNSPLNSWYANLNFDVPCHHVDLCVCLQKEALFDSMASRSVNATCKHNRIVPVLARAVKPARIAGVSPLLKQTG